MRLVAVEVRLVAVEVRLVEGEVRLVEGEVLRLQLEVALHRRVRSLVAAAEQGYVVCALLQHRSLAFARQSWDCGMLPVQHQKQSCLGFPPSFG